MIIYNKLWLSNLLLIELVGKAHRQGSISDTELHKIRIKYPVGFYSPNLFIRAGLFILTLIICLFSGSLVSMVLSDSGLTLGYPWLIILGAVSYTALIIVVKRKCHYRSCVDDALLWISFSLFSAAFSWVIDFDHANNYIPLFAFTCLLGVYLALRFSDMLMSLCAYLSLLALIYFAWQNIGPGGTETLPFVLMLVSAVAYALLSKVLNKSISLFYSNCIMVVQIASLISLYAAGNYFIVKELGDMLNNTYSASIPFGWFFWMWTLLLPLVFIFEGLRRKNKILVRVGLLLSIVAAITLRHYYHAMALEFTLIMCGVVLLGISWYATRYLATPKHGFTDQKRSGNTLMDQLKLESLIISESSAGIGNAPSERGVHLGGGKFGGGGADGSF